MSSLVATIGLEVHVQLATRTRLLSSGAVPGQPQAAGSPLDAVSAGHPGTLPVLNAAAVELAIRAALALDCAVQPDSQFDRKHYFWPDLPKGYQVTQQIHPLARDGTLWVPSPAGPHPHHIDQLHLEEDAAALHHGPNGTRVDLTRCGVPLVEVVGAPDLHTPQRAEAWARMLHRTLVAAGVTPGRLEHGHLRMDANLSLAPEGDPPGDRVEIKNLNSFRFLRRALEEAWDRQARLLARGERVASATLRWDGAHVVPLRDKPTSRGYAMLPEPDLSRLHVDAQAIARARATLPCQGPVSGWLLQKDQAGRALLLKAVPGLTPEETVLLVGDATLAELVHAAAELAPRAGHQAARLAIHDLRGDLPNGPDQLTPAHLAHIACVMVDDGVSHGVAVTALRHARQTGRLPARQNPAEAQFLALLQDRHRCGTRPGGPLALRKPGHGRVLHGKGGPPAAPGRRPTSHSPLVGLPAHPTAGAMKRSRRGIKSGLQPGPEATA